MLCSSFHIIILVYISNIIACLLSIIASLLYLLILLVIIFYFNFIIKVYSKLGFDQGKPSISKSIKKKLQVFDKFKSRSKVWKRKEQAGNTNAKSVPNVRQSNAELGIPDLTGDCSSRVLHN